LLLSLRKRLDQFSFKFVNLSETVIRQAAAHSLSILRDLNDLLTLEPSLSDLELKFVFKRLQFVDTRLVIQSLIYRLHLLFNPLHPLIQGLFQLFVVGQRLQHSLSLLN